MMMVGGGGRGALVAAIHVYNIIVQKRIHDFEMGSSFPLLCKATLILTLAVYINS